MTFEFDGEKYKKASSHQKEWGAKLISEFEFQGSEHILDLGCGDGAITVNLANQVPGGSVQVFGLTSATGKGMNIRIGVVQQDSVGPVFLFFFFFRACSRIF